MLNGRCNYVARPRSLAAGGELGRMDGRVVSFGAAVGKNDFERTRRDLMQFLRQIGLRLVRVKRGRVLQRLDLFDNRSVDLRICVADADRKHAAKTVEILVALIVPNVKAFTAHQRQRLFVVSGHGRKEKLFVFSYRFGLFGLLLC